MTEELSAGHGVKSRAGITKLWSLSGLLCLCGPQLSSLKGVYAQELGETPPPGKVSESLGRSPGDWGWGALRSATKVTSPGDGVQSPCCLRAPGRGRPTCLGHTAEDKS